MYLEERSLFWPESSVLSWHEDVNGRYGSGLGGSGFLVGEQFVTNNDQIVFGEHETDVGHDVGENLRDWAERFNCFKTN